jgi:uncharacterized protein YihD (DUF1040 family)
MTINLREIRKRKAELQRKIDKENIADLEYEPLDDAGNIVPTDPRTFYKLLGPLFHPRLKTPVTDYAPYQWKGWEIALVHDLLCVKTNKCGFSTTMLDALIQNSLLKKNAGYEKLIIAQSAKFAREHLYTIRKRLIDSPLHNFLIQEPRDYLLADETTKVTELYIHNPYKPSHPTRIISTGASAGAVVSWKMVDFVLMSDITKSQTDYTAVVDGATTRLSNTEGRTVIETIPNGPQGKVYEIYEQILADKKENIEPEYELLEITADEAVAAGVMTQKFLDRQRKKLGPMFAMYYGAKFTGGGGNVFLPHVQDEIERLGRIMTRQIKTSVKFDPRYPKAMGIDPGYGHKNFAIVIAQLVDGVVQVIFSRKYETMDTYAMTVVIRKLMHEYGIDKVFIDITDSRLVYALKQEIGEGEREETEKKFEDFAYNGYIFNGVAFSRWGMAMVQHMQQMASEGLLAVDPDIHGQLMGDMATASIVETINEVQRIDKGTNKLHLFDAIRLACMQFIFEEVYA